MTFPDPNKVTVLVPLEMTQPYHYVTSVDYP